MIIIYFISGSTNKARSSKSRRENKKQWSLSR